MQPRGKIRVLLNDNIFGEEANVEGERQFFKGAVTDVEYDPEFFETAPTMWASAYAFGQRLKAGNREAVSEWVSLFLLHYFCVLHLGRYSDEDMQREYDPDLWPALNRTYIGTEELGQMALLQANDGTVVGAYAPNVLFFPSRGRSAWQRSNLLAPYLEENKLSWSQCRGRLLTNQKLAREFQLRLDQIRKSTGLELKLRDELERYSNEVFGPLEGVDVPARPESLGTDPLRWPHHPNASLSIEDLLKQYPLVKEEYDNQDRLTKRTFYLLDGLPETTPWMLDPAGPCMPSPSQFRWDEAQKKIIVKMDGVDKFYEPKQHEHIVLLKNCFVEKPAYFSLPDDTHFAKINSLHLKTNTRKKTHEIVQQEDKTVVWLAPVNETFIREFPEVLTEPEVITTDIYGTDWNFLLRNHRKVNGVLEEKPYEVKWTTQPEPLTTLRQSKLAIWPPKSSSRWNLYVAYGTDTKEKEAGRWRLVGDQGLAETVELEEKNGAEYLSILQGKKSPNRPRAIMLSGPAGKTEGLLFLALDTYERPPQLASLAFDFGTSNTCLAYKPNNAELGADAQTLNFGLEPLSILGSNDTTRRETTSGFVPFSWARKDGFYPSALSSRNWMGGKTIAQIGVNFDVEDMFRVNIPSLYASKRIQETMFSGDLSTRHIHTDMKWRDADPDNSTWRSLFIGLSLLYAHAEMFFNGPVPAMIDNYIFTYPLAFTKLVKENFRKDTAAIVNRVRNLCYVNPPPLNPIRLIDESTAIACSERPQNNPQTLEIFIDTGGGTTDLAIRCGVNYLALDSFKISGKSFFYIAAKNYQKPNSDRKDAARFRQHLSKMLRGDREGHELTWEQAKPTLGDHYSYHISDLRIEEFVERESAVLYQETENENEFSFQRYRTRLFFQHILAYALLQGCAAVANTADISPDKIHIVLGGNAWGLLMFAGWERSEQLLKPKTEQILALVKKELSELYQQETEVKNKIDKLKIFKVSLLNEGELSKAKTAVAKGALTSTAAEIEAEDRNSFTGIHISGLKINDGYGPIELRWCDRWGARDFGVKMNLQDYEQQWTVIQKLEIAPPDGGMESAMHPSIRLFTKLTNLSGNEDPTTEEQRNHINGRLCAASTYLDGQNLKPQSPINIFVSEILYPNSKDSILDELTLKYDPNHTSRK